MKGIRTKPFKRYRGPLSGGFDTLRKKYPKVEGLFALQKQYERQHEELVRTVRDYNRERLEVKKLLPKKKEEPNVNKLHLHLIKLLKLILDSSVSEEEKKEAIEIVQFYVSNRTFRKYLPPKLADFVIESSE